jgi:hypothetical protein
MRIIPFAEIRNLVSGRSSPEKDDGKVTTPCLTFFFACLSRVEVEMKT